MTSSREAYSKFLSWKKDSTPLKVILSPREKNSSRETHRMVSVFSTLEAEEMVGIVSQAPPGDGLRIELFDAAFSLSADRKSLEAVLPDGTSWMFSEEVSS